MADTTVKILDRGARVRIGGLNPQRVTLDRRTIAEIANNRPQTIVQPRPQRVGVVSRNPAVHTGAGMGVQGRPGETEGATFNAVCGETIHGQRAVRIADGNIYHPNTSIIADATQVVGVAMQAGSIGDTVSVRFSGRMTENYWNWVPGYVYCGADGILVQPFEPTGWLLAVARVIDAQTIEIDIDNPVIRS